MAQAMKPARSLPPLLRKNGAPLLRHDPGELPPGSNIIDHGGCRPSLPSSHTKNATPVTHGAEIYMYSHIHTNQVLYSQTRHLSNKKSMSQLAFFGKKTRPAHLRKDLWMPVFLATFPTASSGNEIWKRLQEYKRLHETAYDISRITEKEGARKGQLMQKKERAKVLMDQKANSIADLAEALRQWAMNPTSNNEVEESKNSKTALKRMEARKRTQDQRRESKMRRLKGRMEKWERLRATQGEEKAGPKPLDWANGETKSLEGVEIRWADLRDAEYVADWPSEIVHAENLRRSGYTAAWPEKKVEKGEDGDEVKEVEEPVRTAPARTAAETKKPWYRRLI